MEFFKRMSAIVNDKEKMEKIIEMSFSSTFYIIHPISIRELTQEDLKIAYEIDCLKHNKTLNYDKWLQLQKDFNCDKYKIGYYDLGYFLQKEQALYAVEHNLAGMDEGGCYPFAIIEELRFNVGYPSCSDYTNYELFEINDDYDGYHSISWDKNEKTKAIKKEFILLSEEEKNE